ncbi:hypothetical protein [Neobacillus drentensis]|nr:hypothetical protein [Neobacillus drentensis]
MEKLTSLFHQRIGMPGDTRLTFEKLTEVLEKTVQSIPFESLLIR